jgi:hypothetical protein
VKIIWRRLSKDGIPRWNLTQPQSHWTEQKLMESIINIQSQVAICTNFTTKESRYKNINIIKFHLYKLKTVNNIILKVREKALWPLGRKLGTDYARVFSGCLLRGCYLVLQKLTNSHLWYVHFSVCILYFKTARIIVFFFFLKVKHMLRTPLPF